MVWPWGVSNHTWPQENLDIEVLEGFSVVCISGQAHMHRGAGRSLPVSQSSEQLEAVIVPCVTLQTTLVCQC